MKEFLLLYNSKYSELANVCKESIESFSRYPCHHVNIGHEGESQLWFTYYRYQWLKDYLKTIHYRICLVDADMIATPRVDEVWNLPHDDFFPFFERHPHQPVFGLLRGMVNVCSDFTYRHYVPSLWSPEASWFASIAMNTMSVSPQIGEEHAANLVSWRCDHPNYFDCVTVSEHDPNKAMEGLFYHGEKNVQKAKDLLKAIQFIQGMK